MSAGESGLRLDGVTVGYRDRGRSKEVVRGIDVIARPGELTALIGPNGTGKSTLLRTIAGLQKGLGGAISLDGMALSRMSAAERARHQSIVLTERVAPGKLTGRELVGLGRHPHTGFNGRLTARDHEIVAESIAAVGAGPLADRDIAELSDGERQRIMTARALAQQPRLLLMDEPSAFLDAPGRVALAGLVRRIARQQDVVVVISTHEVELMLQVADRLWLLDRSGNLHDGTPEDLIGRGLLAEVFDSEDLAFDPVSGTFRLVSADLEARLRRAAPGEVDEAITSAAEIGPYFEVDRVALGVRLVDLGTDRIRAWSQATCERIGTTEFRVGAATWQFGLMARLWSALIGSWATDGVIPDLDGVGMTDEGGQLRLTLRPTGGWADPGGVPADRIAQLMVESVAEVTDPLHERLVGDLRMARGLLEGNRAAAAIGAVRALRRHGSPRDPEPLLTALVRHPALAPHHELEFTDDDTLVGHVRRSCCLLYRTDGGSTCGDCPVRTPTGRRLVGLTQGRIERTRP